MDFNDTPEEAQFRAEARAWLEANAPRETEGTRRRRRGMTESEALEWAKAWQAKKADSGWACIHWPAEYGGRGATPIQRVIWDQEEAKFDVPQGFFGIGQGMCAPVLMMYANEDQKRRHLPPLARGEDVWCQLFSEPGGGSDLAGLRTRAERDGDGWVVNGQKIWTSGAHYSDYGILVTRSDPNVPKHEGLTFFFLDMKSPGIEIRPIKQISGAANFNEVFFTDVRIPDSQRLGGVGDGWKVSITTLMNERLAVGGGGGAGAQDLINLAREIEIDGEPAIRSQAVRTRIADWFVQASGLKYTRFRTLSALSRGDTPGPEASIGKVVSAANSQELASFAMDLEDMAGIVRGDGAPMDGRFQETFMSSPGIRIAGGTDEILRNVIAERVLGLPGDIRVDKGLPFNKIPSGKNN